MGKRFRGGFTLIELSLSLIFIATLSLAVVFLIQNLTASYRRGLILNQVNTVGMDLIDDFRISIQNANAEPITKMCERMYAAGSADRNNCIADGARSFAAVTKYGNVTIRSNGKTETILNTPIYGAFCTGTYTYIWNTGYFESPSNIFGTGVVIDQRSVNPNTPAVLGTRTGSTNFQQRYQNFRLLKIYDDTRSVCVNAMMDQNSQRTTYIQYNRNNGASYNNNVSNKFVINSNMLSDKEAISEGIASELLKKEGKYSDLVLYELNVAKPALSATRVNSFYAASFILGTMRGGINIRATGNNCRAPSDDYSDLEYCAINKFNFAVMAGGN